MRSWRKNPKDDTKGDLYEYLLNKISQSGINGQFRTPRHIIKNVCPGRTKNMTAKSVLLWAICRL